MTSTELTRPPDEAASLTFAGVLAETVPLVGVIPVAGPAAILLAVPWLCFGLLLAGPFALVATTVVLLVVAAALIRLIRAICAVPYRLFRQLRPRVSVRAPVLPLVASESRWHPA
jgi:hypothetical protein